jgi:hypothetical protein
MACSTYQQPLLQKRLLIPRYLEKRIGEHSGRQNLPEGWKWQKRWFVFTDTKGMLYYFKTADDPPNYRGVIDIKCGLCPQPTLRCCIDVLLLTTCH